jgi:hypothetical protein
MFNNKINYRYYGLNVRVMPCGTGLDKTLIVQALNPLTGDYVNQRTFHESNSRAYTEAAQYAQALSNTILTSTGK